jgi:hypothetical protein
VVGTPVFVIYVGEDEADTVGTLVTLIGVSDTVTEFVKRVDSV